MACGNEQIRFIPKMSTVAGTRPTIPSSDNHQDGSWIATDIYKGEMFYNVVDGIMWTRALIDSVDQIVTIDGYTDFYKSVLNQSGTADPIAYNAHYSFSSAITWARTGTGVYTGTLTGEFISNRTMVLIPDQGQATGTIHYEWTDVNTITLKTFSAGSPADSIITKMGIFIGMLPEQNPAS